MTETKTSTERSGFVTTGSGTTIAHYTGPTHLVIKATAGEELVRISMKDGSITYGKTYTPDAAAKAFWDAITRLHPKDS